MLAVISIINCYSQTTIKIYTKGGQPIDAFILEEMDSTDIKNINAHYRYMFPKATILDDASQKYNCHSFAWNMSDGGVKCWINNTINNKENLSKYWTEDYYHQTTEQNAIKIFYYNVDADHSAIVSPTVSGMYESKWGKAPLMRHAPNYGPYPHMDERRYYSNKFPIVKYGLISCSNGVGEIGVNVAAYYRADFHYRTATKMVCAIETGKGDDAVEEGYAIVNETYDNCVNVTFTRAGLYEMYFRFYDQFDELVGEYWFEPLVRN